MTSDKKREANKRNAARSTGPKTAAGKARAARNAVRHGLTAASLADPCWVPEVSKLVEVLVRDDAPAALRELATQFAAAQIDLLRIQLARQQIVNEALNDQAFEPRRRRLMREAMEQARPSLARSSYERLTITLTRKLAGDEKAALVFSELIDRLIRLDPYERRSRSRRRSAMRAFDKATSRLPGSMVAARLLEG